MEFRQIKTLKLDVRLAGFFDGAGLLISAVLYFMYIALAAGYHESWPKNASVPGDNIFEMLAFFHLISGFCFAALLLLSFFQRRILTLLCELPLLAALTLSLFRLNEKIGERWPSWIGEYSKTLVNFSYIDILLALIVLALWLVYIFSWFRVVRNNNRSIPQRDSSHAAGADRI